MKTMQWLVVVALGSLVVAGCRLKDAPTAGSSVGTDNVAVTEEDSASNDTSPDAGVDTAEGGGGEVTPDTLVPDTIVSDTIEPPVWPTCTPYGYRDTIYTWRMLYSDGHEQTYWSQVGQVITVNTTDSSFSVRIDSSMNFGRVQLLPDSTQPPLCLLETDTIWVNYGDKALTPYAAIGIPADAAQRIAQELDTLPYSCAPRLVSSLQGYAVTVLDPMPWLDVYLYSPNYANCTQDLAEGRTCSIQPEPPVLTDSTGIILGPAFPICRVISDVMYWRGESWPQTSAGGNHAIWVDLDRPGVTEVPAVLDWRIEIRNAYGFADTVQLHSVVMR